MGIKMKKNAMRVLALILAIVFLVPIGTIAGDEKSELKNSTTRPRC